MDAETSLAAALAALASSDDEQALEHLVAAWQHCRAARLATVVDALASRVEAREKFLGGRTANDRYEAFRATAERGRQADLARLVALLPKLAYGDVSAALDSLLYHWRYTPRMGALLAPISLPGYSDRLDELRAAHAAPRAEPSPRAGELLAEIERMLGSGDDVGDKLLAQVYADPAADAPRLVYADWATSKGDLHGELISLQFARLQRAPDATAIRRERELLDQYMQRWLAPIWTAIRAYSVRFERGFLASATVEPFAVISARPEWSTVVALELAYHEALPMKSFPALRELRNVTPKLFAQIAQEPTKLVHLGLAPDPSLEGALRSLDFARVPSMAELDTTAFPDVTSLGVWGDPGDWWWLWGTRVGKRLTRLEVAQQFPEVSQWLEAPLPDYIREVCIRERSNEARLYREGSAYPRIDVVCRELSRDNWTHMLAYVGSGTLREARFVMSKRAKSDTIDRLERETRRFHPALERFTVDVDPFL